MKKEGRIKKWVLEKEMACEKNERNDLKENRKKNQS